MLRNFIRNFENLLNVSIAKYINNYFLQKKSKKYFTLAPHLVYNLNQI